MEIKNIKKAKELFKEIERIESEIKQWGTKNLEVDIYIKVIRIKKGIDNGTIMEIDPNEFSNDTTYIKFPAFSEFMKKQIESLKSEKKKLENQLTKL